MINKISFIVFLLLMLSACGGNDSVNTDVDYSGTWDVRYNMSVDGCGIITEGVPGFVDQHVIEQTGNVVDFSAISNLIIPDSGELRTDNSLFARQYLSGDLYSDGSFCEFITSVAYEALVGDTANSLFSQTVTCNDGWSCESRALGTAVRQPTL